jgi:hypothetical protein
MSEYTDLLDEKPTDFKIFLYNILKQVPALQPDYKFPNLGVRLIKRMPVMFFGGTHARALCISNFTVKSAV